MQQLYNMEGVYNTPTGMLLPLEQDFLIASYLWFLASRTLIHWPTPLNGWVVTDSVHHHQKQKCGPEVKHL